MKRLIILSLIVLPGCFSPSKETQLAIDSLNMVNPDYEFSFFNYSEDVYLKLKVKKTQLDSAEIRNLYTKVMSEKVDSTGKQRLNWVYLIVYNSDDEYLFTVSEFDDKGIVFFKDAFF